MTGQHFLERVDDTPPHSIRPFIFTIKRLKTPLQIHSIDSGNGSNIAPHKVNQDSELAPNACQWERRLDRTR
jgi:hypothetical protein